MRRGNIFWGLVIILVGAALLMNTLGIITINNIWGIFWPMMLVVLGLWFLLGPVLDKGGMETMQLSIPLENAQTARLKIRHGAGKMDLSALSETGKLLQGSFVGGVEDTWRVDRGEIKARLKAPHVWFFGFPPMGFQGFSWTFGLTREIPLNLDIKTGASESNLDLHDLKVTDLSVEAGASKVDITLPAASGVTRVRLDAGAASLTIRFPEEVAGRIEVNRGLAGINVDLQRFPQVGNVYQSPGFETAVNRVQIYIDAGIGAITIN